MSSSSIEIDLESSSVCSDYSSNNSVSTGISGLTENHQQTIDDETATLAAEESRHLTKLRFFLITVLFWSTVGVGLTIWVYFEEQYEAEFEVQYDEDSEMLFHSVEDKFVTTLGVIDLFVEDLSVQVASSEWPFVTIQDFSIRAEKLRKFSNAALVTNYFYVTEDQRTEWEEQNGDTDHLSRDLELRFDYSNGDDQLLLMNGKEEIFEDEKNTSFLMRWQQAPVIPDVSPYDWNGFQNQALAGAWDILGEESQVVMSYVDNIPTTNDPNLNIESNNQFMSAFLQDTTYHTEPYGNIFYPIITTITNEVFLKDDDSKSLPLTKNETKGILSVTFYWRDLLKDILPKNSDGMSIVVTNTCNQSFTYTWFESDPVYLGNSDLHDTAFDHLEKSFSLTNIGKGNVYTGLNLSSSGCAYELRTYPSKEMLQNYQSSIASPSVFTGIAVVIFIFTSMVFIFYDCLVERRQKKVYTSALRNTLIVSSLFPKNVRDRLYEENTSNQLKYHAATKTHMKSIVNEKAPNTNEPAKGAEAPIADLFLNCTVLFADISGFTSWSSERSPGQVFVLLETIYGAFDRIAERHGVFKVETIGDCYMAVTGLPNPTKDHALIMAKFARDCRDQMSALTKSLEVSLGPETSDLAMRFGLHSGQVTAGVLRGQKSRFQLFGDTVNTAARMESTGLRNHIQISEETARLIKEAAKDHWLTPRNETVQAKGKGELSTYWVFEKRDRRMSCASTVGSTDSSLSSESSNPITNMGVRSLVHDRRQRLIDWNVDLFAGLIQKIVARQGVCVNNIDNWEEAKIRHQLNTKPSNDVGMVLDEVVEIIELPVFDPQAANVQDSHSILLSKDVMTQLRTYIIAISNKYKENSFHSFEHASHVTMSVAKLLSRIVAPDLETSSTGLATQSSLHDHTYGITSDPLTQFACIFAALIHDVDHQGVPNVCLVQENDPVAQKYKGRSVAEQNSVDIAWGIFLEPRFDILKNTICTTDKELQRLRQLVVNTVLATDIMDKDLKQLRNERWEKAFSSQGNESNQDQINRKATIVLEHLIQASDVSHTMQHWHVYRKWNERFFEEMYGAYKTGRAKTDPATFWYKGELGFFDHYIIPLSKKLSDCGVFGVSSDEYLNYAMRNRKEWEQRGEAIVDEMVKRLHSKSMQS